MDSDIRELLEKVVGFLDPLRTLMSPNDPKQAQTFTRGEYAVVCNAHTALSKILHAPREIQPLSMEEAMALLWAADNKLAHIWTVRERMQGGSNIYSSTLHNKNVDTLSFVASEMKRIIELTHQITLEVSQLKNGALQPTADGQATVDILKLAKDCNLQPYYGIPY
jgi:hypothetical protein